MSRNGSGVYSLPVGNPVVTGTVISSSTMNTTLSDIASALTQSLSADGQTPVTANLAMAGFKLTGLGAGSATGNSLRYEQLFTTGAVNLLGPINEVKTTVASATTPDIWTSVGNIVDYTGTTTATGFAAAPQAGATRILVCAGAAVFTAGANVLIDGIASGSNYTAIAGQKIRVIAVTTTQFRLTPQFVPFIDSYPVAQGSADATKQVRLDVSGLTTATTRVITVADQNFTIGKQPTRQVLTSGTGATYTTPTGATRINVRLVGGGGGGSAAVTNAGTAGNNTTFGTLTGGGGGAGQLAVTQAVATGGAASGGDINIPGAQGCGGAQNGLGFNPSGGSGGNSFFGGAGGSAPNANGGTAAANSGSGGAGGGGATSSSGGGGGAGGYVEKLITAPSATYTYTVGAAANGGAAGGTAGGNGAAGIIIVDEYYD